MRRVVCLIYGYGQLSDGIIDCQTKSRCDKAINLWKQGEVKEFVITVSAQKSGKRMAESMSDYLVGCLVPLLNIKVIPRGGNTAGETDVFLSVVGLNDKLHIVSTWYHLPRIWWLWLWRGRCVHLHASMKDAHWVDLKIEPVKILKALLFPRSSSKITH